MGFNIVKKVWSKVRGDDHEESSEHEATEDQKLLGFGGHGQRIVKTEDHEHDKQGKHREHCGHVEHIGHHHHEHAEHHLHEHAGHHHEHAGHHHEHLGQVEHSGLGEHVQQGEHDGFVEHDGLGTQEGDVEIDYDKIPNPFDKRFESEEDKPNAGGIGGPEGDADIDYDKIPNPYDKRFQSEEEEPIRESKRKDCRAWYSKYNIINGQDHF